MLRRAEKEKKVEELAERVSSSRGIYLADFSGLDVASMNELRRLCREAGIRFEVVKNTLGRFAARKAEVPDLEPYFEGPTALATAETDEVAPARVLTAFAKEHAGPRIRAAVVEGRVFEGEQIDALAALPPRDVLLGNLLRVMLGPLTQFASVLQAPMRDLASVLDQVAKGRGGADSEAG